MHRPLHDNLSDVQFAQNRIRYGKKAVLWASAAAVGLLAGMPASAQTTDAQAPADQGLIIVTAQRRSEVSKDVPISITSISSDQITRANIASSSDIAKLTPGLRYDTQGAFVEPTIRGIGTQLIGAGVGSNVGTYIDGFYVPSPLQGVFALVNIDSIQVLKGPQGTLFGRNTNGGAILINTTKPSTDTRGLVEASYGSYNAKEVKAYFTTGLGESIAFDIGGDYRNGDGYVTNISTGNDKIGKYENWLVRTGVKANLSDRFSVLFRYEHQSVDDPTPNLFQPIYINGAPATAAVIVPGAIIPKRPNEVSALFPTFIRTKVDSYQLTMSYDFDFGTLTSYSQIRKSITSLSQSFTNANPDFLGFGTVTTDDTKTQEFLLTSNPGGRLQWTVGAFYLRARTQLDSTFSVDKVNYFFAGGSGSVAESLAAYADVTYQVADKLFLTGGLRYSHDKSTENDNRLAVNPFFYPDLSFNRLLPRAVIRFTPDANSSLYASIARGYKAGQWNLGANNPNPVKPESLTAYEVGYKYAARGLSFELSAYYNDWKQIQVSNFVLINNQALSLITNAASGEIYGIEGQGRYAFDDHFDINVSASYAHARYKSFTTSPANYQCLNFLTCGDGYGQFQPRAIDASGFHLPRSPTLTASLGLHYKTKLAGGRLDLSSNVYYSSKIFFDTSEQFSQDPYATVGLRAEWTDPSDHYTLAVFADNITNHHYYNQILAITGSIGGVYAAPVTVGGSVRAKF